MKIICRAIPILMLLVLSCNTAPKKDAEVQPFEANGETPSGMEEKEIIYALSIPTDISQLFEQSGTNFNPDLLTDLADISLYEDNEQIALVTGALGIDMSYCKIYMQSVYTAEYFEALEQLSEKLEIPEAIFKSSARKFDLYFDNPDSLSIIINSIYREVNEHFKRAERGALASISLFGGWIEAMHIAANIYNSENHFEMGSRILHQKFALNNMISLLSNYQESLNVRGYVLLLNKLRKEFDRVEILYHKEGFEIDTTQKKLQMTGAEIKYDDKTLDKICLIISQIHEEVMK